MTFSCPYPKRAYNQGFITTDALTSLAAPIRKSGYGEYLLGVL